MRTYVCDSCEKIISDPFEVEMKEFYYVPESGFGFIILPNPIKRKIKIHLCGECFKNLNKIAKEMTEEK